MFVFFLLQPAKLMSKRHPYATMTLLSSAQTPHPSVSLQPLLPPFVCFLKPSNEIHTKQDGRLDAVLPTVPSASLCLSSASSLLIFYILSHSLLRIVLLAYFHSSLSTSLPPWTSISSRSYSSIPPDWFLFVFIHPSYHPSVRLNRSLLSSVFAAFPFGQVPFWNTLALFPFIYLDKSVCVCVSPHLDGERRH